MKTLFAFAACIALSCIAVLGALMGTLLLPWEPRWQPHTPRSIFETRRAGLA